MINVGLLWLLLLPLVIGVVHLWILRENLKDALIISGLTVLIGSLVTAGLFYVGVGTQTSDVEIWSGKTVSKERIHDSYVRSYSCNCRQVCSGSGNNQSCSTVCDTCYEDHYTVTWRCNTSLGKIDIDHKDWTSRAVYLVPDPARYTSIVPNEPVAVAKSYTNYVQAVPQTLFKPSSEALKQKFVKLIPKYPDSPFDYYRLNRFLSPGINVKDTNEWNWELGLILNDRGARKQVNVIVVIAPTADANYEYALRDAWQNGNKNDVILVIGSSSYPKIDWVRIITWSKSEQFKVELRDRILALGDVDRATVIPALADQIDKNFERRKMSEFKYLEGEIDPPTWMIAIIIVLQIGAAFGVQYVWRRSQRPRFGNKFRRY